MRWRCRRPIDSGRRTSTSTNDRTWAPKSASTSRGVDVDRSRHGVDRCHLLRWPARSTHRGRCSRRRTTQPATTASQAVPRGGQADRRGHRARRDQVDGRVRARARRQAGSYSQRDVLATFGAHVRSFVDVDVLRPLSIVADTANGHGRPRRAHRVRAPFRSISRSSSVSSTARSRTTRPIRSSPRTCSHLVARVVEKGADVGLPSTATRPRVPRRRQGRGRCRDRPPLPSWRRACSRRTQARRSSTTASARRRCPRSSSRTADTRAHARRPTASSSR